MKHRTNLLGRFTVILVLLVQMASASGIGYGQTPIPPSGTSPQGRAAPSSGSANSQGAGKTISSLQAPAPIQAGTLPLGFQYVRTFGITGQPYPAAGQNAYLNRPAGITFDSLGNLYTVEQNGNRLWGFQTPTAPPITPGLPLTWAPYGVAGVNGPVMDNPMNVYAGPGGNLWVGNWRYITVFDPVSGTVLDNVEKFDNPDGLPHRNQNNQFDCIQGFDMDQSVTPMRLFVAQTCNYNEVLVLDVVNPTDPATRTFTLRAVIQGNFWNPSQVQFADLDGSGKKLYMAYNGGLVAFSESTSGANNWTQAAQYNGQGLSGLALNPTDTSPKYLYAAGQAWNGSGVLRCDAHLSCEYYIQGQKGNSSPPLPDVLWDPFGLVFDSAGGVYVTDQSHATIEYFSDPSDPANTPVTFYGTAFKPYDTPTPAAPGPIGNYYYNNPSGVASDSQGNVYILEQNGARLTKLGPDGSFKWSFGTPGTSGGNDGNNSTRMLNRPQGSPAVDALGRVYIPDRNNNRVAILDSDGSFLGFIGQQNTPNYQFNCPIGVSIGPNGDIFVVDDCANNVQIYNSERYFRSSIGGKGNEADASHFSQPSAIAVIDRDTVLVADRNNARIQKCTRIYGPAVSALAPNTFNETWTCSTFAGVKFDSQSDNYHFDQINGLAWDGIHKRLYTSEDWRNSFKVFDENAKLIAVIGEENNWGMDNYHLSSVVGLGVDPYGSVYAIDQNNNRVQKYIPVLSPLEYAGQMGGTIDFLTADSTHLYTNLGARLAVFDSTGPQPALVGTSALLPGTLITNPVVTNGSVFALTNDNALRAFSVADPTHPTQVGMIPIIQPTGLGGKDGWLFTVSCCGRGQGWNGPRLVAIDGRDPAHPVVAAWMTLDPFKNVNDWYVDEIHVIQPVAGEDYQIYLTAHEAGVLRVSFAANTLALGNLKQYTDGSRFTNLALNSSGSVLYVVDRPYGPGSGHLHLIDTGSMTSTSQFDAEETDGIFLSGSSLYLHNSNSVSIRALDGTILSTHNYSAGTPDIFFRQIYVTGAHLYGTARTSGLLTFNITLTTTPPLSLAGHFKVPAAGPIYLEGIGSTLYDSGSEGGLRVIDASNPAAMAETFNGSIGEAVSRTALAAIGAQTYAFMLTTVGGDNRTLMLAVASAAAPGTILATSQFIGAGATFGGEHTNTLMVRQGAANHARVYVPGADTCIYIYDVNFSVLPVTIGFVKSTACLFNKGFVSGAAFYGNYLLAAAENEGVHVLDLAILDNPKEIGVIQGNPNAIEVIGNTAYITDFDKGLRLIDLQYTTNASPKWPEIGNYWFPNYPGNLRVKAFGAKIYAYIPNGDSGLRILDVSNPLNITPVVTSGSTGGFDFTAYVNGSFVYEASYSAGLYAYWAPPTTQAYLANTSDQLDSSAVDGVTYHLNMVPPEKLALLHMPVFTPNAPPLPTGSQAAGHTFAVFARSFATDQPVTTLSAGQNYTLAVQYTPAELAGMAETSLGLYYWNGSSWVIEPTSVVDAAAHTLTATPNHFSLWSLFGWLNKPQSSRYFIPIIKR